MLLSIPLVLLLQLGISLVAAAPPLSTISHKSHVARKCGSHISAARKASMERKFSAQRKLPSKNPLVSPVIDVNFNIIAANHTVAGGWLPISQVLGQIAVLNKDFKASGIQFRLVNTTRIINANWFTNVAPENQEQASMKQKLRKGGPETLNLYTVSFNNSAAEDLLGYATFPSDYKSAPQDDGVVIQYQTLPGGTKAPFNMGRTTTHEVGHWVGLYHTFQGASCTSSGDEVADTPAQLTATSGCPKIAPDTCPGQPGRDPIHNFMDYSHDVCLTGFTAGQAKRLKAQLRTYRNLNV
ncbi:hypothetical protein M413DRAFT_445790 [Hebeloma cylindrosporum]|uniref:Peptidase M43 pregnancy-associated plasma-A domain-containing protein n=1 Tax=Hebeloma cylindrosporum TaxID=76867 RepID=A0A0C2XTQ2_HEBCY|nr:hypothetical protein M413DRAFT_445790 [Hebeloma cylindrosporum h7]